MIKKITRKLHSGIRDKDNKDLVKGGVSALVMRSVAIGFNYLLTFMIAWGYGAAGSGIFAIYQKILQFASTISKMGFDTLLMRSTAEYAAQNKWGKTKDLYFKTLLFVVPFSLVISAILYFFSGYIASSIFLKPALEVYCKIASFSVLPLVVLGIHADCLRGMKKIVLYSFIEGVSVAVFSCLLLAIFIFYYDDKIIPLLAYLAALIITAVISITWWWRKSQLKEIFITEQADFTKSISVAFTLFTTALLQIIRSFTNTLILARFGTEEEVGIFNISFRIATVTSIMLTAILLTVAPKIAELYAKGDIKKMALISQNATKIIFWTSIPIIILFIVFPETVLGLFGEEFKAGWLVLIILSIGQFINAASGPVGNVLIMTGKQKISRNVLLFGTIVAVTLNFILIPHLGMLGAAVVNLITVCIINIVPLFIVKYYYGFYTINFRTLFSFKLAGEEK